MGVSNSKRSSSIAKQRQQFTSKSIENSLLNSNKQKHFIRKYDLDTCFDYICDVSSSANTILIFDCGKLKLFKIDDDQKEPEIIEWNNSDDNEQIIDIKWSNKLDKYLLLTHLSLYEMSDKHTQFGIKKIEFKTTTITTTDNVDENGKQQKQRFMRFMTCYNNDLIINFDFGNFISHYSLTSFELIREWAKSELNFLSEQEPILSIKLSDRRTLGMDIEMAYPQTKRFIDFVDIQEMKHLKRIQQTPNLCLLLSLHDCQWLAKCYWPGDRSVWLIESDGFCKKLEQSDDEPVISDIHLTTGYWCVIKQNLKQLTRQQEQELEKNKTGGGRGEKKRTKKNEC